MPHEPLEQRRIELRGGAIRSDHEASGPALHRGTDVAGDQLLLGGVIQEIPGARPDENVDGNRCANRRAEERRGWGEASAGESAAELDAPRTTRERLPQTPDVIHTDFQHVGLTLTLAEHAQGGARGRGSG